VERDSVQEKGTDRKVALQVQCSVGLCGRVDSSVGIATRCGLKGPRSNPCECEIFRNHRDRPWDPPSLLNRGHRVSFKV